MNKNNIIIGCDLHNTLLLSNEAWINAIMSFNSKLDKKEVTKRIYDKESRKKLALEYNIDYNQLLDKYHSICLPNFPLISFINELKHQGFKIFIISSASKEKVHKDLLNLNKMIQFTEVYTKENFNKRKSEDWDAIIDCNDTKMMVYIGNDYDEDIIDNKRVLSILAGHFFKELKQVGILTKRGE